MIEKFVHQWEKNKHIIRNEFATKRPDSYLDLVKTVIANLYQEDDDRGWRESPDATRITEIDHGHCQGTLVYVIACTGYQPSEYWSVMVGYGSCSGCDTLQAIQGWGGEISEKEVDETMTLALHIVQNLKQLGPEYV